MIVFASTVGVVMSIPGQTMGVSVFTESLIEALGLSRVQLSTAYMFGTIVSSLLLPLGGYWFDRWGARALVAGSCVLLGLTLIYSSQSDRIARFLAFGAEGWLAAASAFACIFIGFSMIRFSGQGLLSMTSRAMLGKWFNRRRGFVSGIHGVVVTFLFSLAPLLLDWTVSQFGWRGAWIAMGFGSFAMALFGWLFFRDNPEECGLEMDAGWTPKPDEHESKPHKTLKEFTRDEAIRDYSFWVFSAGISCFALIVTAVTFHIVSIAEQAGLDREQAFQVFFPMAVVSILCNFVFGWISDFIPLKWTLAAMMALMGLGLAFVPSIDTMAGWCLVVAGLGGANGIFAPLLTVVWPEFYGRKHLGAISGLNMSIITFASAIGPFIFGLSMEWTQSYHTAVYATLVAPAAVFVLSFRADNPQDRLA